MNFFRLKYLIFGYVKISNVFSKNDLDLNKYKIELSNKKEFIRGEKFLKDKNLFNLFFKKKLLHINKKIFGDDFLYSPGFVAQHNHYGDGYINQKKYSIFHIDSDYEWQNNESYLSNYSHKLAKIGFYTQSHKLKCNILLFPFLHHIFKSNNRTIKYSIGNRIINLLRYLSSINIFSNILRPSIEPGDVVIFDCMLPHGSDLGNIDFKLTLYNEIGSKSSMTKFYYNNIKKRAELENHDENFERDRGRYKDQLELTSNIIPKILNKEYLAHTLSLNNL